jgi:hypothetical protein
MCHVQFDVELFQVVYPLSLYKSNKKYPWTPSTIQPFED